MNARAAIATLLLAAAPVCAQQETQPPDPTPAQTKQPVPAPAPEKSEPEHPAPGTAAYLAKITKPPPETMSGDYDWVQLTNGEWLRGDIKEYRNESLVFDSDEFDDVTLDWDKVHALKVRGNARVVLDDPGFRLDYLRLNEIGDRKILVGPLKIEGDTATVDTAEGPVTIKRDEIRSIVGGAKTEWDNWSGKLSFGFTLDEGNNNSTDISSYFKLVRRDALTRFELDYSGAYTVTEGVTTTDNHRSTATYDYYTTERLFIRPLDLEVYRDPFQNIKYRITPAAGFGYALVDNYILEWRVNTSLGYRYTEYYDTPPGEAKSNGSAIVNLGTTVDWNVTNDIDFGVDFTLGLPVPETNDYTIHLALTSSVNLTDNFDLDVQFIWDHTNDPAPNEDGSEPDPNQARIYVGIGWEF